MEFAASAVKKFKISNTQLLLSVWTLIHIFGAQWSVKSLRAFLGAVGNIFPTFQHVLKFIYKTRILAGNLIS